MKAYVTSTLIALILGSCAQPSTTWPMRVDNSEAINLDPKKSSLEEHIYVLSPLKAATRDSEEYRARLRAGLRHTKTIDHPGGDYLYVPPNSSSNDHEYSHVYRLDRSKGRFYVTVHWNREMQFEFFYNDFGWWMEDPSPELIGSAQFRKYNNQQNKPRHDNPS